MKKIQNFWDKSDKFFSVPLLFSLGTAFFITLLFLIFYSRLPDRLPLFYSLPWGQNQLAQKQQFFLLPGILILITLTNTLVASHLHQVQSILKNILTLTLCLVSLTVLITAVKIIFIFI